MSDENEPLFVVNQFGNISIGTMNAVNDVMLSVDGIVDAENFLRNGQPLSSSLAENSFWKIGTTHYGQAGDVHVVRSGGYSMFHHCDALAALEMARTAL